MHFVVLGMWRSWQVQALPTSLHLQAVRVDRCRPCVSMAHSKSALKILAKNPVKSKGDPDLMGLDDGPGGLISSSQLGKLSFPQLQFQKF